MGPRGQGRAPGGGRALDPRGQVTAPPSVFSVPNILKYFRKKNRIKFSGHSEYFYFWVIFHYMDNSENRQKNTIFALFNINNRK